MVVNSVLTYSGNSITGISQRLTSTAGVLAVNVFGRSGGYTSVYASNLGSSPRVTDAIYRSNYDVIKQSFFGYTSDRAYCTLKTTNCYFKVLNIISGCVDTHSRSLLKLMLNCVSSNHAHSGNTGRIEYLCTHNACSHACRQHGYNDAT